MRFDVVTIFPEVFPGPLSAGVIGKALAAGTVVIEAHDLRDYTTDRHRTVDDTPYGGGAGMVLKPEPVFKAVRDLKDRHGGLCVLLTPQGRQLNQKLAAQLAGPEGLILVAGRYEGFDDRIRTGLADVEVSIGDYVLSGGELAAMVLIETVARLVPGVLGDEESARYDSFSQGLLEHPHYTRPADFEGQRVPDILVSGDHEKVAAWRRAQALDRTKDRRPDLLGGRSKEGEKR